jgi:SAM-dependent methyltransferase
MHLTLQPLLEAYTSASWLTVGDGRYGSDAHYLEQQGVLDVVASSLTDATLTIAVERGFIRRGQAENAEALSADDRSFDFVLCKEAYHHFPRPAVAFYEMLRVAREGVVLIEPIDQDRLLNRAKDLVKVFVRNDPTTSFEPSGNFLYRMNTREIEKSMTALNYSYMATKKFNDFYHPRLALGRFQRRSAAAILTRVGILVQDALCRLGLLQWGLATVVVFKTSPSERVLGKLRESGYRVMKLPDNPFLQD